MDVNHAKLGEYFAASARLIDCRETLDSRIVSDEKARNNLCWAGELLECIDWDCANYETARKNYQLSDLSSMLRSKFYQTLFALSWSGNFSSEKPFQEARSRLDKIYTALKSSQLDVLEETDFKIAGKLFDEFQRYLLRASRKPEDV